MQGKITSYFGAKSSGKKTPAPIVKEWITEDAGKKIGSGPDCQGENMINASQEMGVRQHDGFDMDRTRNEISRVSVPGDGCELPLSDAATCELDTTSEQTSSTEEGSPRGEESQESQRKNARGKREPTKSLSAALLERRRRQSIAVQQAMMQSMGLLSELQSSERAASKRRRPQTGGSRPQLREEPRRRSARLRSEPAPLTSRSAVDGGGGAQVLAPPPSPILREEDFDDSSIYKYMVDEKRLGHRVSRDDGIDGIGGKQEVSLEGIRALTRTDGPIMSSGSCSAIYSLYFDSHSGGILAAGGKAGMVSIIDAYGRNTSENGPSAAEGDEARYPLMDFKGHSGWVSSVQLLSFNTNKELPLLLSSGNDGFINIWDLCREKNGTPRLLCSSKEQHSKGIFAMHLFRDLITSGGKDKRVVTSRISESAIMTDRVLDGHRSVVKDVRFRDADTLASCGDDACALVHDLRSSELIPSIVIENIHQRSAHTVRWNPSDINSLATAGLDGSIKLWDIRNCSQPLHVYEGHTHPSVTRVSAIRRPEFFANGSFLLTGGQDSNRISMYDTKSGSTVSRGALGDNLLSMAVSDNDLLVAVALPNASVALLRAVVPNS